MINSWTLLIVKAIDNKHVQILYFLTSLTFPNILQKHHVKILKNTKFITILRRHINIMRSTTSQKRHNF